MLIALTVLNVAMVILTGSLFSVWFMLSNGLNLLLAAGLLRGWPWTRYLTILRALLGVLLGLVGVSQGAIIDFVITTLLLGGIGLPLIGRATRLKNALGFLLFALGAVGTLIALMTQLVVVK